MKNWCGYLNNETGEFTTDRETFMHCWYGQRKKTTVIDYGQFEKRLVYVNTKTGEYTHEYKIAKKMHDARKVEFLLLDYDKNLDEWHECGRMV